MWGTVMESVVEDSQQAGSALKRQSTRGLCKKGLWTAVKDKVLEGSQYEGLEGQSIIRLCKSVKDMLERESRRGL